MNTSGFLGRGWSFPPSFSEGDGQVDMVADPPLSGKMTPLHPVHLFEQGA